MPRTPAIEISSKPVSSVGLIGQAAPLAFLERSIKTGRLVHAYLFTGPAHVGKMTVARAVAVRLLGDGVPLERHPDFLVVEPGRDAKTGKLHNEIVLDQVHALRGWLSRGAFHSGWKVVIIDGADLLNKEAANALLKNLEEPKDQTLLLLLAASADDVAPTIRSRCQTVAFGLVPAVEIRARLIADGLPEERAGLYARLAAGRPGLARIYASDPAAFAEMSELRSRLLEIPELPVADRWLVLDGLVPDKLPFNEAAAQASAALDLLAELMRDALLAAFGRPEEAVHADVADRTAAWAGRLGRDRIASVLQEIIAAKKAIAANAGIRGVLGVVALAF